MPHLTLNFSFITGARAETAEQMADVLNFNQVHSSYLHSSFSDLGNSLMGSDKFTLAVANRLYGAIGSSFLQQFLNDTR